MTKKNKQNTMKTIIGLMTCAFMVGCNEDNTASIKALETVAANLEQAAKALEVATKNQSANLEQAAKALEAATKNHKDLVTTDKAKSERYEYKTVYTVRDSNSVASLQRGFNAFGKEGWKFIGFCMVDGTNGRVCVFSRKLP